MLSLAVICFFSQALGITVHVNSASGSDSNSGTEDLPFETLQQVLESAQTPEMEVMLQTSNQPYLISRLGVALRTSLLCAESSNLSVLLPVLISPHQFLQISNCLVTSSLGALKLPAFQVLGELQLRNCNITNFTTKVALLIGVLDMEDCLISSNFDSFLAAAGFGFQLRARNCGFVENYAIAGTVFALQPTTVYNPSNTTLELYNCLFANNSAAMGGSVLYLFAVASSAFTTNTARTVTFTDCRFSNNSGYPFVVTSKEVNFTFSKVEFRSHSYLFVLSLYSGVFQLNDMYAEDVGIAIVVNYLAGAITGNNVTIKKVTKGPALYLNHRGKPLLGSVTFTRLSILNFTGPKTALSSGTIIAFGVILALDHYNVSSGFSMSGTACIAVNSIVTIFHAEISAVHTYAFGLILCLFSSIKVTDLNMHDIYQDKVVWIGSYFSVLSFTGLRVYNVTPVINMGLTGGIRPYAAMTITATFNSFGSFQDTYLSLPDVLSSPPFYLTNSDIVVDGLIAPIVRSDIVDTINSHAVLRNFTIGYINYTSLIYLMHNSSVDMDLIALYSGVMTSCILTITDNTNATFYNVIARDSYYNAFVYIMNSRLDVRNLTQIGVRAIRFLPYIFRSSFTVSDFYAENSTFDLVDMTFSSGIFTRVTLINHTAIKKFISLISSQLLFEDLTINGLKVPADKLFLRLQRGAEIVFRRSALQGLVTQGSHFSEVKNSYLVFDDCDIGGFTATLVQATGAYVEVQSTRVREGGVRDVKSWSTAGFLICRNCLSVEISDSFFIAMKGKNGGAISVSGSRVVLSDSVFARCEAVGIGGVVHSIDSGLSINNCTFDSNSAVQGGVLYHDSKTETASFNNCSFTGNHANEGAVVWWSLIRPFVSNPHTQGNFAIYGDFEATHPSHLAIVNASSNYITGTSGMPGTTPVIVAIKDVLNQTVATENSTNLQLLCESADIAGGTVLSAQKGVVSFSSLLISAQPGSLLTMQAATSPPGLLPGFSFKYFVRKCEAGELTTALGCAPCPKNTYSFDPLGSECSFCPNGAYCPGGATLVLDAGYWRPDNLSDSVFLCVQKEACLGQENSTCSAGYTGRLCATCNEHYYWIGSGLCVDCFNKAAHWIAISCLICGCLGFTVVFVFKSFSTNSTATSTLGLLRLLANTTHLLQTYQLIYVDWGTNVVYLFFVLEGFTSFGVSAWTSPCVQSLSLSTVYLRALAASFTPVLLVVLSFVMCRAIHSCTKLSLHPKVQLIVLYLYFPYAVRCCIELVVCVDMEEGTSWLRADLNTRCWTTDHHKFVKALFTPMLVIYCFACPCLFFLIFVRAKIFSRWQTVKFLTAGYVETLKYWEFLWLGFKVVVICAIGLAASAQVKTQLVLLSVCLYIFVSCLYLWHPFETRTFSVITLISMSLLTLVVPMGYFRSPLVSFREEARLTLEGGILLACGLQLLITIVGCLKSMKSATVLPEPALPAVSMESNIFLLVPHTSFVESTSK